MGKKRYLKIIVSILLAVALVLPVVPQRESYNTTTAYAATSLANISSKDGIILQCHMWSFNNIRTKLADIANAGYKTIQVSPVQGQKNGSEWWNLYQPTNQSIGNSLGSRDEFVALCNEADSYGINIIVDAVMNHMANASDTNKDAWSSQVASDFQRTDFYHNLGQCSTWTDRYCVTQQGIGMPDLNTQSSAVQAKAITFLNDCIAAGADGFRFDAAKHIETNVGEDAGKSWAGNYWTNVLGSLTNKNNLFIYGEVLDEANSNSDNLSGYASFMSVTDHNYGFSVRNAVKNWNLSAAQNWSVSLPIGKRVSYVENHDNFEHNESGISDDQRKIAWGILAARDNVTPMYLSRRTGSVGSMGTTDFANTEIAAVNWFHNAMIGQTEYLRYASNNNCMLVDRGTVGTAIINEGGSFYLSSATNLASGTYADKGGSGASFTVSNGYITGQVPGNRIVVLYNSTPVITTTPTTAPTTTPTTTPVSDVVKVSPSTPVAGQQVTITYNATGRTLAGSSSMSIHYGYDSFTSPQTVAMSKTDTNTWSVTFTVPSAAASSLDFCFTNGSSWDNNSSKNWSVSVTKTTPTATPTPTVTPVPTATPTPTATPVNGVLVSPTTPVAGSQVTITYDATGRTLAGSSSMSLHYGYDSFTSPQTIAMSKTGTNTWSVTFTVPSSATKSLDFCFTNGSSWDNNSTKNWSVGVTTTTPTTVPTVTPTATPTPVNGVAVAPTTPVAGQQVTITYYATGRALAGSSAVSLHYGYDSWVNPQNIAMTKTTTNVWTVTFTVPTAAKSQLNFCFTNGSSWDNNSSSNWNVTIQ